MSSADERSQADEVLTMIPAVSRSPVAALVLVTVAVCMLVTSAQAPPKSPGRSRGARSQPLTYPAPTNLKVLPKDLSGQQVHNIMEGWAKELGARCDACHVEDPDDVIPGGPARTKFSDDSKQMKEVARLMFTMTEEINGNYVAKLNGSGLPVTCGTCHRGRISPEPFASSLEGEALPAQAPLPSQQRLLP
jgi:hypothetical protein